MCSIDDADLVNRGLVEVDLSFQLIARQGRCTLREHLPSRRLIEGQPAYRAPVKRSEGELPRFVNRTEVGIALASPDGRNNRIPSPII